MILKSEGASARGHHRLVPVQAVRRGLSTETTLVYAVLVIYDTATRLARGKIGEITSTLTLLSWTILVSLQCRERC